MTFEIFDYRTTNRNILVTPEIRARLYRMEPGQVDGRHSHDLGHELFLILEGRAAFEISGEIRELGPGELCVARSEEIHQVRNLLPDKPTIMYLSVTPHIQPTHTGRKEDGSKEQPPRFRPNSAYDVEGDPSIGAEALADRYLEALQSLAQAVDASLNVQQAQVIAFKEAVANGDTPSALRARDQMWDGLYPLFKQMSAMGAAWNSFTARTAESESK